MIMEGSQGSASTLAGFTGRRRRSALPRRPRDIKGSLHCFTFLPPSTQATTALSNEPNPSVRNTNSLCGSVSENPLKLKLKLGGVTRTIQTNSEAGVYTDTLVKLLSVESFDFVLHHVLVIVNLFLFCNAG